MARTQWKTKYYQYLTWDQALFSFRFENYIPAGKAKRKDSPNFSGSRYRECMRTAKIGPDLRLINTG